MVARHNAKKNEVSTTGLAFRDALIELVRTETGATSLLLSANKKVKIGSPVFFAGRRYVAAEVDRSIMKAMRLPQKMGACGSPKKLIAKIATVISRYCGFEAREARLLSFFVVSSWVIDGLPSAPQLRICGPASMEASQLFRLLGCLCRHALALTEIDIAGVCSLPMEMYPTLLVRQPLLKGRILRLLSAASTGGLYLPRNGRLVDLHIPIAIFSDVTGEIPEVAAALEIPIPPASHHLPVLDSRTEDQLAREFQNDLLAYRIEMLNKVDFCTFDAPALGFAMRQGARCLGRCVPDDPELQSEVMTWFKGDDARDRLERSTSLEGVVVEAMFFVVHDPQQGDGIHVGQVLKVVDEISRRRGAPQGIKCEENRMRAANTRLLDQNP
jgi:hypothetical protein